MQTHVQVKKNVLALCTAVPGIDDSYFAVRFFIHDLSSTKGQARPFSNTPPEPIPAA